MDMYNKIENVTIPKLETIMCNSLSNEDLKNIKTNSCNHVKLGLMSVNSSNYSPLYLPDFIKTVCTGDANKLSIYSDYWPLRARISACCFS